MRSLQAIRRVIRQRSTAIADRPRRLGMVNWDHARLRAALPDFRRLSIEDFLAKHEARLLVEA
jgi:hypothetical protein